MRIFGLMLLVMLACGSAGAQVESMQPSTQPSTQPLTQPVAAPTTSWTTRPVLVPQSLPPATPKDSNLLIALLASMVGISGVLVCVFLLARRME
jgi:hypothetical protein